MRHLVVNADDLGADLPRNEGIFRGIAAGVVTSVSVLANGPALGDAVGRLRAVSRTRLSVGLHLNLSEGFPLSGDLKELVGPDGAFLGKQRARARLLDDPTPAVADEAKRELDAQLRRLEQWAGPLDHLDGHQHVHLFPSVFSAAAAAAERSGIGWFRTPDEPVDDGAPEERGRSDARLFSHLGAVARRALETRPLRAPVFRGLMLRVRPESAALAALVGALPDGVTELMMHPGDAGPDGGPFSAFSTPDRERELRMLLSPQFAEALERAGVALGPFPAPER